MKRSALSTILPMIAVGALAVAACEKKQPAPAAPGSGTAQKVDDHGHGHDDAAKARSDGEVHGTPIALGEAAFGPYKVKASRDEGKISAGGDAPIDVWVDPVATGAPKVAGVRFWVGLEDGKASVKAKAGIEFPDQANHWHTHAEIPDPLPEGTRLWVEIEDEKGGKHVGSFDLKAGR